MGKAMSGDSQPHDDLTPAVSPSDGSLLRQFRQGSQEAATLLYLRYAQRLRALARAKCSPDLAAYVGIEDLVQSIFGSFFRAAQSGDYDVPAGEELWKFFLVIALNKIRRKAVFHRAAKRDMRLTEGNGTFEWALSNIADDDAARVTLRLAIDEAMERLAPEHRRVVQLRVEGHDIAEIAQHSGRSQRTVERLLQEARKKLKRLLYDTHQ